jgi:hypothetical protein
MVPPNERNLEPSWHSAATLASAIVALGLVMSWPLGSAEAPPRTDRQPASEPCTGGDDVSNFVCRNGWIASLAHHYR